MILKYLPLMCIFVYLIRTSSSGGSDDCDIACTQEYEPVCGIFDSTFKTFGNLCALNTENECYGTVFFGVPSSSHLQPPPRNLCKEDSPVCGFDEHDSSFPMFHTFKNRCEMDKENANFNKNWQAIANCSCSTVDSCAC